MVQNINSFSAEVAELVDALGSGSSVLTHMGVQVPPSAPSGIQAAIEDDYGLFLFAPAGEKISGSAIALEMKVA
jgi:hypothetical protein